MLKIYSLHQCCEIFLFVICDFVAVSNQAVNGRRRLVKKDVLKVHLCVV